MKPNKLFLYYPTANDATFPAYATNVSPARTFAIGSLPGAPAGTTTQLRDRIFDVVSTDYCEFNVQVLPPTTTNPDALGAPPARRNMVAIGADTDPSLFGIAEAVDTGDADVIDHARVFGGSYGVFCSAELSGANNTLDRWALGIGGTAAHEAGHNYGLSHSAVVHTGEDAFIHHIMPAGPSMPCTNRVGERRHFSDQDFGILANNVGLTLQSLANWDFVNPNSATASRLRMEVLSLSTTLTPVSTYTGSLSPWNPPSVVASGTRTFKGTSYHRYFVTWQSAKGWASPNQPGSIAGQVRGAEQFHVGTHFAEENILNTTTQVVIADATLLDAGGSALPLHPRVPTFDTGTLSADGNFILGLANLAAANLVLRNWRGFVLPRPAHIDSMLFDPTGGVKLFDNQQEPITPWRQLQLPTAMELPAGSTDKPGEARFVLGNLLKDGHNVRIKFRGQVTDATAGAQEVNPDVKGALATDPFPGASVFLEGDLVEPNALQWDADKKTFVTKDLVTHVFLQVAGKRAKPVDGILIGLLRGKVVCANLNTRQSVSVQANTDGSFDCEKAGLVSLHGERVQVSQVGLVNTQLPAVQVGGMDIAKVTCTNLRSRQSVSFKPEVSTNALDCVKAGLGVEQQSTLQITQIGTVR
ncbi:hypothetical protein ASC91_13135 [Pelomonas sp. Root1237]|nr:hypothetical protein ASC91_13135 [Pelomonas sp. Root1237]